LPTWASPSVAPNARASPANRDRYLAFKRHLVETTDHVDDCGAGKLTWIGDALDKAFAWGGAVGWRPSERR
jgi:hypothetical protein